MKVDSDFVNRLNNKISMGCRWTTYSYYVPRVLWWGGYWVTNWYQVCDVPTNFPGYKPIPSNVVLKAVIGQDNEIDNMIEDTGVHLKESRIAIGSLSLFYAAWFAALGVTLWWNAWWAIPLAVMFTNIAYICFDLPNIWKRAVGSWAGDGFMTEDSQDFLSLNVGGSKGSTTRVRTAHHAGEANGEVNVDETRQLVIETQRQLAVQ
jgi:hypothetical protein